MSLIDASRLNTAPLIYMIEDMLPENGAGFFWGPSGSGKTFTILDAALAVCNGLPFMGHGTLPGTAAYICGEGQGGLGIRIKARVLRQEDDNKKAVAEIARSQGDEAARSFAASLPPYTSDNLKVMTSPFPMHFNGSGKPNSDLEQAMAELRRLNSPPPDASEEDVASWPYLRLVILDALENFAGQLSVSHRSSANRIIATMQWMAAELQCCVLAIAHPVNAPGGQKMVGSDRLFAASDFVIRYAPDDVAAPGALATATISCEKSKDDTKFSSFGVELHPCKWDEPKLDENWEPVPVLDDNGAQVTENGKPAWVTEEVTSQTVRLIEQDITSGPRPSVRQAVPAPELRDNRPASRIRPVLRPEPRGGPHLMPVPGSAVTRKEETSRAGDARVTPPAVVPAAGPEDARRELMRALLTPKCPACDRPAGMGCDARMAPAPLPLARTAAGQSWIHEDRILTAALGQGDPEAFLAEAIRVLSGGKPAPAPSGQPEPSPAPAPVADPLASRLSWTTVRPDSPAPSLAEIMAGA